MDTLIVGVSAAVALAALVVAIVVARSQTAIQHRVAAIEEAPEPRSSTPAAELGSR